MKISRLTIDGRDVVRMMVDGRQVAIGQSEPEYLCFTAEEAGSTVGMEIEFSNTRATVGFSPITVETSPDGETWTRYVTAAGSPWTVRLYDAGDRLYVRTASDSMTVGYCQATTNSATRPTIYGSGWQKFTATGRVSVSGKIMSMMDKTMSSGRVTAGNAFSYMFKGCAGLVSAAGLVMPSYPSGGCCQSMFEGCTSLTQAPALPSTSVPNNCYNSMFKGCTALTEAPELPATTLKASTYAYKSMFEGCTSLTAAPAIKATNITTSTFASMFKGCTSLASSPDLLVTNLGLSCCQSMFEGCTSLTRAPALPAKTLLTYCYQSMFEGCTSLTDAGVLVAETMKTCCYKSMFKGCTSLVSAPDLASLELADSCYESMFEGCTALTKVMPDMPAETLATSCYKSMFKGCTALTEAPELNSRTLATNCYMEMFHGCTSLEEGPYLPATTLAYGCYQSMFYNCSPEFSLKVAFEDWGEAEGLPYTTDWLMATGYATGVFKCPQNLAATMPERGDSSVPESWTVTPFADKLTLTGTDVIYCGRRWSYDYGSATVVGQVTSDQDRLDDNGYIDISFDLDACSEAGWSWTTSSMRISDIDWENGTFSYNYGSYVETDSLNGIGPGSLYANGWIKLPLIGPS